MNNSPGATPRSPRWRSAALVPVLIASALAVIGTAASAHASPATPVPDLGPNVHVVNPSMPQADIQALVDGVAAAQVGNQFGTRRDAILFMPGTYGSSDNPLNFQVGYYTEVAGLGQNPGAVLINGSVDVDNQCDGTGNNCLALNNFWRSLSNLTIVATHKNAGCRTNTEFWAVSQASPLRRVRVNGAMTFMDYCTNGPQFASGGFMADSYADQTTIVSGSQQQFLTRNSTIGGWSNGVWNQVFSGVDGAPAEDFHGSGSNQYTVVAATPASREKPYLYVDGNGVWSVFVPDAATDSSGPTWSGGANTPGRSVPLSQFYVATSADSSTTLNAKVASGSNLLLTPGVYSGTTPINIKRAGTIVLGLGMATFASAAAGFSINVGDVAGVDIAGIIVDAGAQNASALMRVGTTPHATLDGLATFGPNALQDVFFRIGGAQPGRASTSLIVNADATILDDIWAWRADHGAGVGWTSNTAATGLLVNGDDVTATGLFVEHYQGYEVIWRGENGKVVFFQNEMPYDVPNQAAWKSPGGLGYAAFKVLGNVQNFSGSGMASYNFFNQGRDIWATHAFETPTSPNVRFHDLVTVFLDPTTGRGGVRNVIDSVGGPANTANHGVPVIVQDYPVPTA